MSDVIKSGRANRAPSFVTTEVRNSRPVQLLTAAAISLTALLGASEAMPSQADAKIVPGVGIDGVRMFDKPGRIWDKLGQSEHIHYHTTQLGSVATWFYKHKPLQGVVGLIDNRVHSIDTASKREKTSQGIGPGSSYNATVNAYPDADCNYLGPDKANCILSSTYGGEDVRTIFTFQDQRMQRAQVIELSDHSG
jgi:hypothetical protein